MGRGRRSVLIAGLALTAAAFLALSEPGAALRAAAGPLVADLRARVASLSAALSAALPGAARGAGEGAARPVVRTAVEDGRTVVRLSARERARVGLATAVLPALPHRLEIAAYGSVLDLARVTELTNSYAAAVAVLQTARARAEVSASAARRARSLGTAAVAAAQIETAEGSALTDQAAVTAAESQLRTLAATAQQEWGPVLGRAIVERSPLVTRLIERADFLMQVTLPPGEGFGRPPQAAFAEVPPQSARVALRLVSPATRTDPRIQGQSFFYLVSGESGLLPGMSTMAFLPGERAVTGVLVPEDAVVHGEGGTWVYRGLCPPREADAQGSASQGKAGAGACTGEGGYVRHPVRPDAPMSADAFVVEDLPGGTEIVLKGGQSLLSEELKSGIRVAGDDDD